MSSSAENSRSSSARFSSAASALSNQESNEEGFAFNGSVYPTYVEMVAAKRERNRKVLEKSVGALSSVLGSGINSTNTTDDDSRRKRSNKNKRRRSPDRSAGGIALPLRRRRAYQPQGLANPKRSVRSTTSSISSQSHISSSCQSPFKRLQKINSRLNIPVPSIPDGQAEHRVPCPEIGPGWTMRIRARKKVPANLRSPAVDRVFLSPTGKILRSLNDVDRFLEEGSAVSCKDTEANASSCISDGGSTFSTSRSYRTIDTMNLAPMEEVAADISKARQKISAGSSVLVLNQPFPKCIMVKDLSASLEHILLNGGRVQARESIWEDYLRSDTVLNDEGDNRLRAQHGNKSIIETKRNCEKKEGESRKEEGLVHLSDWKMYHPFITDEHMQLNDAKNFHEADHKVKTDNRQFVDDFFGSDDISIPSEYLAANTELGMTTDRFEKNVHLNIQQEALPIDNPVKYNNNVRKRHSYYTSQGPDRHWDEEFGDGVDPMVFVEECCVIDATTLADGIGAVASGSIGCGKENGATYFTANNYSSSLLQRCWDRAVHAASNTIAISTASIKGEGSNAILQTSSPKDEPESAEIQKQHFADSRHRSVGEVSVSQTPPSGGWDRNNLVVCYKKDSSGIARLQNKCVANSILCREAMNAVDCLLDALLSKESEVRKMLECPKGNQYVDWRHVFNCLQDGVRHGQEIQERPNNPGIKVSKKRLPLNCISLKSLSMRLIERYGTGPYEMPL